MLDLSAAFEIIDHNILFDILFHSFVLNDCALNWINLTFPIEIKIKPNRKWEEFWIAKPLDEKSYKKWL